MKLFVIALRLNLRQKVEFTSQLFTPFRFVLFIVTLITGLSSQVFANDGTDWDCVQRMMDECTAGDTRDHAHGNYRDTDCTIEAHQACSVDNVDVTGTPFVPFTTGVEYNAVFFTGGSTVGGGGRSAPPRPPAPPKTPEEKEKECKIKEAELLKEFTTCIGNAKNEFAERANGCSINTEINTEVNPVVGSVSATTAPNATCVANHERTKEAALADCDTDKAVKNVGFVESCWDVN